jgi:hypothetical protein
MRTDLLSDRPADSQPQIPNGQDRGVESLTDADGRNPRVNVGPRVLDATAVY